MTTPAETQFPNGETFHQMSCRVPDALEMLLSRHRRESIAIVTHAGVIRVVLSRALAIPDHHMFRLAQRFGAINQVNYFEDGPIVELING